MLICQAQHSDKNQWDDYAEKHLNATPYHLWAWKESIETAYQHNSHYLLAKNDSTVCGIFPLIHLKLPLLQNQLVSLPFCDLGGPLADNLDITSQLLASAIELGNQIGAKKIEIRTRPDSQYQAAPKAHSQPAKVSMLLNLPDSSEELWNNFKSKLRSQVRKAEKNGLVFRWGDTADIDAFYTVFSKNMHELGSPVHSKKWIKTVLSCFGSKAKMGLVYFEETPVGCGIILLCGKTVAIPWASTLRQFNRLSPNMLLYWNFLKFSADNRYKLFDFGRSTPAEGTYKFKAQWGSTPYPLHWEDLLQHSPLLSENQSQGKLRNLAEKIWPRLPLWSANVIGPILRKQISL